MKTIKINNRNINISLIEFFIYTPSSAKTDDFGGKIPHSETKQFLSITMTSGNSFTVKGKEATMLKNAIMVS